jgi:hypothetical protein
MTIKTHLMIAAALSLGCTLANAQTTAPAGKAKPAAAKPAMVKPAKPVRVAKAAVAAPVDAPPGPASRDQLAAAERVHYGDYECELGQKAVVSTLPQYPGYAEVRSGKSTWLMKPIASSTGAIRLEDLKERFLVIQIANKSMLFDSKTGQRVLDGCVHASQRNAAAAAPSQGLLSTATK